MLQLCDFLTQQNTLRHEQNTPSPFGKKSTKWVFKEWVFKEGVFKEWVFKEWVFKALTAS